jgi:hypothetical protein
MQWPPVYLLYNLTTPYCGANPIYTTLFLQRKNKNEKIIQNRTAIKCLYCFLFFYFFTFATKPLRIRRQDAALLFNIIFQNNGMTGMLNVSVSVENTSCLKN